MIMGEIGIGETGIGEIGMSEIGHLLTIAGVLLVSVVSPGPNFAIVTSTATRAPRRAGIAAGFGLAVASATWAILAVAGVGIVIAQVPWLYAAIRIVGAAYLILIGARMLLGSGRRAEPSSNGELSGADAFRKAYVVSMTNPKALVFYSSILTLFMPVSAGWWFYVAVVALAAFVSAGWYCSVALMFSQSAVRRAFASTKKFVDATMGAILVGLGGKLLLNR